MWRKCNKITIYFTERKNLFRSSIFLHCNCFSSFICFVFFCFHLYFIALLYRSFHLHYSTSYITVTSIFRSLFLSLSLICNPFCWFSIHLSNCANIEQSILLLLAAWLVRVTIFLHFLNNKFSQRNSNKRKTPCTQLSEKKKKSPFKNTYTNRWQIPTHSTIADSDIYTI